MVLFVARLQERRLLDEGEVQELLQGFLAELPMLLAQNLQNVHRRVFFAWRARAFKARRIFLMCEV